MRYIGLLHFASKIITFWVFEVITFCIESYYILGYYYILWGNGVPCIVRADNGTENMNIAVIQRFFRTKASGAFAGEKSFFVW